MTNRNELAKVIKQQRVMKELSLHELGVKLGVSSSHLGRIERGERFPSARILQKIAKPLGFDEAELFTLANYLTAKPSTTVESEAQRGQLDPYAAVVLSQEPVEVQRSIVFILTILKSIAKGSRYDIGFAEYAHRKYPEVDEDTITMVKDILEHHRPSQAVPTP